MPLLNTYQRIHACYLLPDKIQLNFQFALRWSADHLGEFLYQIPANTIGLNKWHFLLNVGEAVYPVTLQYIPEGGIVNCYVTFNALSDLHLPSRFIRSSEIPVPRSSRNWLFFYHMQSDNRHIWDHIDYRLGAVTNALTSMFTNACRELGRPIPADLPRSITVTSVEVCCDLRCLNPRSYVSSLKSSFATYLGEVEERPYGLTPRFTERYGAGHMISASRSASERIKAYAKTSERVRLEYRLDRAALRNARINRRLGPQQSFRQFFQNCASHCAWYFDMLLQDRRLVMNINSDATPIHLLALFAGKVRDVRKLRELLDILVLEGSIENSFDRQLIDRLKRTDPAVLIPSWRRGYSGFSPRFRRAAWQLRNCQRSFSVASPRRRQRTSQVIRGFRIRPLRH